jgi:hypothetical protein
MKDRLGRLIREGRAPLALIALLAALVFAVCVRTQPKVTKMAPPDSNASAHIARLIEMHAARLMAIPGVHGVAEGRMPDGRPCILLLAEDPNDPALPKELEGFPVRVQQSDTLRAY